VLKSGLGVGAGAGEVSHHGRVLARAPIDNDFQTLMPWVMNAANPPPTTKVMIACVVLPLIAALGVGVGLFRSPRRLDAE